MEEIGKASTYNDTIGGRNRDLPGCNAVLKPIAPSGAPIKVPKRVKLPQIIINDPRKYLILDVFSSLLTD